MNTEKVYVETIVKFTPGGDITPLSIVYSDGIKYRIDRISDVRPAASLKAGGAGIRYTVRITGRETYLFLEGKRWFVEGKSDSTRHTTCEHL